jgi:hypothetical protein
VTHYTKSSPDDGEADLSKRPMGAPVETKRKQHVLPHHASDFSWLHQLK